MSAGLDGLAATLADEGFTTGSLFGLPCLKSSGKAVVCEQRDGVAFRLVTGTPEHAAALSLESAELLDYNGYGRRMKDWVWVPATFADQWPAFARAAAERVATAKPAKKKTAKKK